VRAFFANGGSRCHVATVRRPDFHEPAGLEQALRDLVGVQGSSEAEATGLERLLLVEEVSVIDVPDLYARLVEAKPETVTLGSRAEETRFIPCTKVLGPAGPVQVSGERRAFEPLFIEQKVLETQQNLLRRCIPERWRVLLLLSPPWPATVESAFSWRDHFDRLVKLEGFAEIEEMACAALYFPWVLAQERVDAPVVELPPTPFAAGVIARRDLARGPHVAPANETLRGVVGLTVALDDDLHGRLYSPDPDAGGLAVPAINVLRAFPGFGIQVWGARTLSTEKWLRYLPVRRCLSAIERRVKAALDPVVFEPNTPLLWLQVTHLILGVLLPVFDSGALRGERPEHAFYVLRRQRQPARGGAGGAIGLRGGRGRDRARGVPGLPPRPAGGSRGGHRVAMPLVNPVPAFNFTVFLFDAKPIRSATDVLLGLGGLAVGAAKTLLTGTFSEVCGLNAEVETEEYREGGRNSGPHKLPKWGIPQPGLQRGVTFNTDLWTGTTRCSTASGPLRKHGVILLTDRGLGISRPSGADAAGLPVVDSCRWPSGSSRTACRRSCRVPASTPRRTRSPSRPSRSPTRG
jgi:hypothetical protein